MTTPASYPECHRFESYLSHTGKPQRLRTLGHFLCLPAKCILIHSRTFQYMVWLSKRLSESTKKRWDFHPSKTMPPGTRFLEHVCNHAPTLLPPFGSCSWNSISHLEGLPQPFCFRFVPFVRDGIINGQDHFSVCVTHPRNYGVHFNRRVH